MSNSLVSRWPSSQRELHSGDYRQLARCKGLFSFTVQIEQTDLMISAGSNLVDEARELVHIYRQQLKDYISLDPRFLTSLTPIAVGETAPLIVRNMVKAAHAANVGPMAAVAGAIAECVGRGLQAHSADVLVENGGDIFCSLSRPITFLLLAEKSEFGALRFTLETDLPAYGVCTSAGSTGPSLSFGTADAVMIAAEDTALADAVATAVGNVVHTAADVGDAVELARSLGVMAAIVVKDDKLSAFGNVKLGADR